jgi:hypothetical protein
MPICSLSATTRISFALISRIWLLMRVLSMTLLGDIRLLLAMVFPPFYRQFSAVSVSHVLCKRTGIHM